MLMITSCAAILDGARGRDLLDILIWEASLSRYAHCFAEEEH
jgi:hypothetical protein